MGHYQLLLVGLAWLANLSPGDAENIFIGESEYVPVQETPHDRYTISLSAAHKKERRLRELECLLAFKDDANFCRLSFSQKKAKVHLVTKGNSREISSSRGKFLSGSAPQEIQIWRSDHTVSVAVNGTLAVHLLDEEIRGGKFLVALQDELDITRFRYLPDEPIVFADDFMVTEEQKLEDTVWKQIAGEWKLLSVGDRVRESSQDPRVIQNRGRREPEPERSANPFSLFSGSSEPSLIVTGFPNWNNYYVETSAKTDGGRMGLVFGYRSPEDYFLLRFTQQMPFPSATKLELVRRSGDDEDVLGEEDLLSRAGNWYKLHARIIGGRIRAGVDGVNVFDVEHPKCAGGKVGLFASEGRCNFDDVVVRTDEAIDFDTKSNLQSGAESIVGEWVIVETDSGPQLQASGSGVLHLGSNTWKEYLFEAEALPQPQTRRFGIGVKGTKPVSLIFERKGNGFALNLTSEASSIDPHTVLLPDASRFSLAIDLTEPGVFKAYVNNRLEYRIRMPHKSAAPFLHCEEGARFTNVRVFGHRDRALERSPKQEIFVDDPYMQGWASNRWAWLPVIRPEDEGARAYSGRRPEKPLTQIEGPNTWIHKGDIHGPVHLSLPLTKSFDLYFGVDEESVKPAVLKAAESNKPPQIPGYSLKAVLSDDSSRLSLHLFKENQPVAAAKLTLQQLKEKDEEGEEVVIPNELKFVREHRFIVVRVDGEQVMVWSDASPLHGRCLAMSHDGSLDFENVRVQREQVKDYLFEKATTDWQRQGTWEVTNRFSCDPRWSHMNGRSKGLAALWNKHDFEGDLTVEFYAGMRMRQADMRVGIGWHYPRIGDINLSLCGDGRNVFSGYSMVHSAWDRRWSEQHTRIYRGEEVVAETDREFMPSGRKGRPSLRPIPVDWDPGGRAIHGAWYYIKVRRTGNRIYWFFDNVPVLSFEDPDPPTGNRLALWTQGNSIVIARAKIVCAERPGPAITRIDPETLKPMIEEDDFEKATKLASNESPRFRIYSDAQPYLSCDFEQSFHGWKQADAEQSAFLTLDTKIKAAGRSSLKLTNTQIGGDFGAEIPADELNLLRVSELSFDYRIPEGVKTNLYFRLRHDPHTRYFVRLTGDDYSQRSLMMIHDFQAAQDSEWHRASIDISKALKKAVPWIDEAIVESMQIGNFHDSYMQTGVGGNPAGLSYHLDNFQMIGTGPGPVEFAFEPAKGAEITKFKWVIDKRASTSAAKSRSATEATIQPVEVPTTTARNWRLLRKALKAVKKEQKKGALETRHLALTGDIELEPGEYYVHVSALDKGDKWTDSVHSRLSVQPPLAIESVVPADGQRWGLNPIRVSFSEVTAVPRLSSIQLSVNSNLIELSKEDLTYHADKRELTLNLNRTGLAFEDGEQVEFTLEFSEFAEEAPSHKHSWQYTVDIKQDRSAPGLVTIVGRPLDLSFEDSLEKLLPYSAEYGAELSLDETTAASGKRSLKMVNAVCGSYSGFYTTFESTPLGQYPILSFDYRTDGYHRLDFMLSTTAGKQYIGFTDLEDYGRSSSSFEKAQQVQVKPDGRWHHAEIDLRRLPPPSTKGKAPTTNALSSLYLADFSHRSNIAGAFTHLDNLSLIPIVSSKAGVSLGWTAADLSGISGYAVKWSDKPFDEPDRRKIVVENERVFKSSGESDRYLHISARDKAGNWGPAAHYRHLIDNTPPKIASVSPKQRERSAADRIDIRLKDAGSGVAPKNLSLSFNGESVSLTSEYVTWDPLESMLSWRWVDAYIAKNADRPNKMKMKFQLSGLKDYAGNEARPYSWSWVLDHSKDKTPPPAPVLTSAQSWGLYHPFTTGEELAGSQTKSSKYGWRSLIDGKVQVAVAEDTIRKDRCLQAVSTGEGDDSAFCMNWRTYTSYFPHLSFDYRFQPGTKVMLRVYDYSQKKYFFIKLTAEAKEDSSGAFEKIAADGKWHNTSIDLHKLLNEVHGTSKNYYLYQFAFGNWTGRPNPANTEISIDNFLLTKANSPIPYFGWKIGDTTGIKGYSTALDQSPLTLPAAVVKQSESVGTPPFIGKTGLHYFHVRAVDGAGNWGPAAHYPYYVASIPDVSGEEGVEMSDGWKVKPQEGQDVRIRHGNIKGNHLLGVTFGGLVASKSSRSKYADFYLALSKDLNMKDVREVDMRFFYSGTRYFTPYLYIIKKDGQRLSVKNTASYLKPGWSSTTFRLPFTGREKSNDGRRNRVIAYVYDYSDVQSIELRILTRDRSGQMLIDQVHFKKLSTGPARPTRKRQ
ncbi:MAG: hypothetical protein QGF00_12000 [Planctomycetota bacterium]|nr:hypothetical protein [Planctomycetota bacterium]